MHVNGFSAPNVGEIWKSQTGDHYAVIQIAQETDTGAYYVIYKREGSHKDVIAWARSMATFCAKFEKVEQPVSTRASGLPA